MGERVTLGDGREFIVEQVEQEDSAAEGREGCARVTLCAYQAGQGALRISWSMTPREANLLLSSVHRQTTPVRRYRVTLEFPKSHAEAEIEAECEEDVLTRVEGTCLGDLLDDFGETLYIINAEEIDE